jgi:hypothetical protein
MAEKKFNHLVGKPEKVQFEEIFKKDLLDTYVFLDKLKIKIYFLSIVSLIILFLQIQKDSPTWLIYLWFLVCLISLITIFKVIKAKEKIYNEIILTNKIIKKMVMKNEF